jgi:predicted Zn-dependent peptidase
VIGLWFGVGARDEAPEREGGTHLLEHLLFRHGPTRSGAELSRAIDATGGDLDANTSREHTVFHAHVPTAHLEVALTGLADVALHPVFDGSDLAAERRVVLEELRSTFDDAGDVAHDRLAAALFPGHPLGREILGTKESLDGLDVDALLQHHGSVVTASHLVVVAAGGVAHETMCRWAERLPIAGDGDVIERSAPGSALPGRTMTSHNAEQAHVEVGVRALPHGHPDRHALSVASQLLGGGPSSRLYLDIRDERGLAYDVWSAVVGYTDAGLWSCGAATAPEEAGKVERLLLEHLEALAQDGPADDEVAVAKGYLHGATELAMEGNGARAAWWAYNEMYHGGELDLDADLAALDAVTAADVAAVVGRLLACDGGPHVSVVTPR